MTLDSIFIISYLDNNNNKYLPVDILENVRFILSNT